MTMRPTRAHKVERTSLNMICTTPIFAQSFLNAVGRFKNEGQKLRNTQTIFNFSFSRCVQNWFKATGTCLPVFLRAKAPSRATRTKHENDKRTQKHNGRQGRSPGGRQAGTATRPKFPSRAGHEIVISTATQRGMRAGTKAEHL